MTLILYISTLKSRSHDKSKNKSTVVKKQFAIITKEK